jgi:hypothetical protein
MHFITVCFQSFLIGEQCPTGFTLVTVIFIVQLELFPLGKCLATDMAKKP